MMDFFGYPLLYPTAVSSPEYTPKRHIVKTYAQQRRDAMKRRNIRKRSKH